ncbi:MAG: MFS transporter [Pseudomonadota bacterium]
MSTISVVRKNGEISIAADTLTSFGDLQLPPELDRHPDKIQKLGDSYVGVVGSAAHTLVIESAFNRADFHADLSNRLSIFETFVKLHALLKDHYYLNPKDDEEDPYESTRIDCVIANPNGIFAVYGLREVYEYEKYWSIGSGSDYALGAMHALYDSDDASAEKIACTSVEAGAAFSNSTALPFTVKTINERS